MIHRLTPVYLDRLESEKNWKLFAGYVIAGAIGIVLLQQAGLRAALLSAGCVIAAGAFHWKLNQVHRRALLAAKHVEVEIAGERLVYRSEVSEQSIFLNQLRSVSQADKFAPIKLEFASVPPLMLDGFSDADKLVEELERFVKR